ncbi:helix-turn-helix domain-containing protein [Allobranchiibius sp. CTAmp26]|uniref:nSTAND1 domain-containing NTPase n=1 Tax=Allobranchiibius sp. CTAmp26 TaxID=2815214 RepID=UPI001AA1BF3E|nr:helix-turn-helix domain-containing protein [Allobranchiibius sp. CTAmp26]MBO1756660.1 helix-turn-helix domain-containing protein [Allobranchiibius sp. CTAmp26]
MGDKIDRDTDGGRVGASERPRSEPADAPAATDIHSPADFGSALTSARLRSGLSVREAATLSGLSPSTAGDYFTGRHLPPRNRPEVLAALLLTLGVEADAQSPWHEGLIRARAGRRPARRTATRSPYHGLTAFDAGSADLFYGRTDLTTDLLARVDALSGSDDSRPGAAAVVGPSGAGKTSLLQAGLCAGVQDLAGWNVQTITPGPDPLTQLSTALAAAGAEGRRLLVIDQCEELWTLSSDQAMRTQFLSRAFDWSRARGAVLVIGLRADFTGAATTHPQLLDALRGELVLVGPMSRAEMISIIIGPAEQVGLQVDMALAELIVDEAVSGSGSTGAAGMLPPISHTLATMWRHSDRRVLTLADYRASGGVIGAIRHTADAALTELAPQDVGTCRRLLLSLIVVDDAGHATSRAAPIEDLEGDDPGTRRVLAHLLDRRLLVSNGRTVRFSHESVIDAWPQLQDWIAADRADLVVARDVSTAARSWDRSGQDPDLLLRGSALAAATDWSRRHAKESGSIVSAFVDASSARAEQDRAQRDRVLRRTRLMLATVSVLALIAAAAGGLAIRSRSDATTQRDSAVSAGLALQSRLLRARDQPFGDQVAAAASRVANDTDSRSAVMDAATDPILTRLAVHPGYRVLATSPRRGLIAIAGDGDQLWVYQQRGAAATLLRTITMPATTGGPTTFVLAFDPSGTRLAVGGGAGRVLLYDVSDPRSTRLLGTPLSAPGTTYALLFSPDGRQLMASSQSAGVRRWSLDTASATPLPSVPAPGTIDSLASIPGRPWIAVGSESGSVSVWDVGSTSRLLGRVQVGQQKIYSLSAQSSAELIVGSDDGSVDRVAIKADGSPGSASSVGMLQGPVNQVLALHGDVFGASSDGSVTRYLPGGGRQTADISSPVTTVAPLDDDHVVFATIAGGMGEWTLAGPEFSLTPSSVVANLSTSANGRVLYTPATTGGVLWSMAAPGRVGRALATLIPPTADGEPSGNGALSADVTTAWIGTYTGHVIGWDVSDPRHARKIFDGPVASATIESIVISTDGHHVFVADDDHLVHRVDDVDGRWSAGPAYRGARNYVLGVAVSPRGDLVVGTTADGTTLIWSFDGHLLTTIPGTGYMYSTAFTTDGRRLAVGSGTGVVRVYAVDRPSAPRLEQTLTGPTNATLGLAFSTTGALAAGSSDSTVWIWHRVGARYERFAILNPGQRIFAVVWSADGRELFAGGKEGGRVWPASPTDATDRICSQRGIGVTATEWSMDLPTSPYRNPCPS